MVRYDDMLGVVVVFEHTHGGLRADGVDMDAYSCSNSLDVLHRLCVSLVRGIS